MFQYCFFDLDGTITDPKIGITSAVAYALEKYGITVEDKDQLTTFIGPPLHESFCKFFGFSNMAAYDAVDKYREYYKVQGIFENFLYDGMADLLKRLQQAGKQVIMATSKPEVFARQIAEHFQIDSYFTCITGSNLDGTRVAKAEVIACAMERIGKKDATDAVMIGDRMHDIIGAKKTGMKSIGVLYGYGSREELEAAGADYIVPSVADLEKLLLTLK